MFDVNAGDGSVRKNKFESPIPGGDAPGAQQMPENKLDGAEAMQLHSQLLNYYTSELDKQHGNRLAMADDEDNYDNDQWDETDAAQLEDRGQKAIVYNVISASVDWVTGTERRSRSDFKILPRRKDDSKAAERKTELMKYLSDVNRTPFSISRAFTDAVKVGVGWLEDGVADATEDEPLYTRYESWRNILWDSNSTELDVDDGRYMHRAKWFDLDIATAMFPKRRGLLEMSAGDSDSYMMLDAYADEAMDSQEMATEGQIETTSNRISGYQRRRVRIIESWIRMPVEAQRVSGGPFHGELFDSASRGHVEALNSGEAKLVKKVTMRMHVAIYTTAGMLWLSESPYRHNKFPFTPVWGKRRGRDGMPYGMIRGLKDIQDDINKRASKAQWMINTNRIIMDEDALPEGTDIDELAAEVARPDAIILKRAGKELKLEEGKELSQFQLELMSRSIAMIQQASGVTDELLGRETGAKSGIAIQRRQDQGSMATAIYFDMLRLAQQLRGEKQLANIEQYMDQRKQFRITNQRGKPEYVEINDGLPENDIVRSKADFIISDEDWHATLRQAATDSLLEVIAKLPPQIAMILLDLVVETMDIANRDEIVKRIRSATGQHDPDATEPTPEEIQSQQAKAEQDQIGKAMTLAQLRKLTAEATRLEGEAQRLMAQLVGTNVDAQSKALTAAGTAFALPPPAVHAADMILAESGFVSQSDKTAAAADAAAQQQQQPPLPPPQGAPPPEAMSPQLPPAAGLGQPQAMPA